MFAFKIFIIFMLSFLDLLALINIFIAHDDETEFSRFLIFTILSLTLIYAVSVYLSVF